MDLKRVKLSFLPETQGLPGQSKGLVIGETVEQGCQGPRATVCGAGRGGVLLGERVPSSSAACLVLGAALVDMTVGCETLESQNLLRTCLLGIVWFPGVSAQVR